MSLIYSIWFSSKILFLHSRTFKAAIGLKVIIFKFVIFIIRLIYINNLIYFTKNNGKFTENYYEIIEKYKLFHKDGIKNQLELVHFGYSLTRWITKIKKIIEINNWIFNWFWVWKSFLYNNNFKIEDMKFQSFNFWGIIFTCMIQVWKIFYIPKNKHDGVICVDVLNISRKKM